MGKTFKDIAFEACTIGRRNWRIIAGTAGDKSPNFDLCPNGASNHTKDPLTITLWDKAEPNGNVDIVATYETGFFTDWDDLSAKPAGIFDDCLTVRTPSGAEHTYHWHDEETKAWANTPVKNNEGKELFSIRTNNWFVVGPGSLYDDPEDGKRKKYEIIRTPSSGKVEVLNEAQREFLRPHVQKKSTTSGAPGSLDHSLHKDFTPDKFLKYYGIEFKQDGASFYVHDPRNKGCPVAGHTHKDKRGKVRNWCQCSFYFEEGKPPGFHCFDDECHGKHFREAHEALQKSTGKKPFPVWAAQEETREIPLECAADMSRRELIYAWKPRLPSGKLIHFMGINASGKSPVVVDLAARMTTGARWPDEQENTLGPKSVILLNAENDWETEILPWFDLAKGDSRKFFRANVTRRTKGEKRAETLIRLDTDMDALYEMATGVKDLGAIFVDPITNYLGKLGMNHEAEMRRILMPLNELAQELGILVVTVGHLNKREPGTNVMFRSMGAGAFVGVAREVHLFDDDPESTEPYTHVMTPTRAKGASIKYKTYRDFVTYKDGTKLEATGIQWGAEIMVDASDALDQPSKSEKGKYAEAAACLRGILSKGKLPARTCMNEMKNAGFDPETLDMAGIRKRASVKSTNAGRNSEWYISATTERAEEPPEAFEPEMCEQERK